MLQLMVEGFLFTNDRKTPNYGWLKKTNEGLKKALLSIGQCEVFIKYPQNGPHEIGASPTNIDWIPHILFNSL